MAKTGQVIRNPVTGETTTFFVTSADAGGKLLEIEMAADSNAAGATGHIHPLLAPIARARGYRDRYPG